MSAMDVDPSASTSEPADVKPVIKKKADGAAAKKGKDKSGKKFEVKKVSAGSYLSHNDAGDEP
jgi:hypothetical protein